MKVRTLVEWTPEEREEIYRNAGWRRSVHTDNPNEPAWHNINESLPSRLYTLLEMIELLPQP